MISLTLPVRLKFLYLNLIFSISKPLIIVWFNGNKKPNGLNVSQNWWQFICQNYYKFLVELIGENCIYIIDVSLKCISIILGGTGKRFKKTSVCILQTPRHFFKINIKITKPWNRWLKVIQIVRNYAFSSR